MNKIKRIFTEMQETVKEKQILPDDYLKTLEKIIEKNEYNLKKTLQDEFALMMIEDKINILFDLALEESGTYRKYSEEDLFKVAFIFMELFLSKTFKYNQDKTNQKGLEDLVEKIGNEFHDFVKKYTGIDLKKTK